MACSQPMPGLIRWRQRDGLLHASEAVQQCQANRPSKITAERMPALITQASLLF